MSPSIEQIEQRIDRRLEKGDVLVQLRHEVGGAQILAEVVAPFVSQDPKRLEGDWKSKKPAVKLRELTPVGPKADYSIAERDHNFWEDVVRVEDRTDLPKIPK